MTQSANRYSQLIEAIFLARYQEGANEVTFDRSQLNSWTPT